MLNLAGLAFAGDPGHQGGRQPGAARHRADVRAGGGGRAVLTITFDRDLDPASPTQPRRPSGNLLAPPAACGRTHRHSKRFEKPGAPPGVGARTETYQGGGATGTMVGVSHVAGREPAGRPRALRA